MAGIFLFNPERTAQATAELVRSRSPFMGRRELGARRSGIHRFSIRSTPQGGLAHRMSSLRCAIRSVFDNKG